MAFNSYDHTATSKDRNSKTEIDFVGAAGGFGGIPIAFNR